MWLERGITGKTTASFAALAGNLEILQYMLDKISSLSLPPEQHERILRETFETPDHKNNTPILMASVSSFECLAFLVQHCPNGVALLDVANDNGTLPAHMGSHLQDVRKLEFILRTAPSGIKALNMKGWQGRTPLDCATKEVKEYFTPQKIQQISSERELELIPENLEPGSLPAIVCTVLRQTIEVQLYRNRRYMC